ncbi:MAG: acyl carrier protein [Pseudomonadota bacterium]
MDTFLKNLAEILEIDEIKTIDRFQDFPEWDSLAVLSVIAMIDAEYQISIHSSDIKGIVNPEELFKLICSKKSK